jgi:rRNA-processing protein FCF1
MFELVGAGGFAAVRRAAPAVSGTFVGPSWPQKRSRSSSPSLLVCHEGFVAEPVDVQRFIQPPHKAACDDEIPEDQTVVHRFTVRERRREDEERQRQMHLLYNPDLPHLSGDPIKETTEQRQQVQVTQRNSGEHPSLLVGNSSAPSSESAASTSEPKTKILVLDTSVLLRNDDPFDMLDSLVEAGYILLVPFTVMSELDYRIKEGDRTSEAEGADGLARTRRAGVVARGVRDWLDAMLAAAAEAGHTPVVHIQSAREIDPRLMRLAANNDDKILACASYFRRCVPCAEIVVGTHDMNLTLKARADGFPILQSDFPSRKHGRLGRRQPNRGRY